MLRELDNWEEDATSDSENEDIGDSSQEDLAANKIKSSDDYRKISEEILIGLNKLREDKMFFDVSIKAGERIILAHKVVLCAASPYFNAMFTGCFIENNHDTVTLQNVDEEMIELMINYIYSGELPFTCENVDRALLTAQFLQIDSAVNLCLSHIKSQTSLKNCLKLICFAEKHSLKHLCDVLVEYIAKNFDKLFVQENFSKIEFLEFKKLITDKRVLSYPPDVLLNTIARWVNYDYDSRIKNLDELLKHINPQHVTKQNLESTEFSKLLKKSDIINWNSKQPQLDPGVLTNWDIAVFRYTGNYSPELYKLNSSAHVNLQVLPRAYFDGSVTSYGGAIYHTGGCLSKKPVSNETQCLSIYKNKWKNFINLKLSRAYHRNCVVDAKLYSVGGTDGRYSAFSSCEYIDLVLGQSFLIKDLKRPREIMGLGTHNNNIYAIGGRNRGRCKYQSIERYDPRIGNWEILNSTSYEAGISSSVTIGDEIYCLCSGKSLERYDIRGDFWTKIITQFNSYPIDLIKIDSELYGLFKNNICQFEALSGKWKPPSTRFNCESSYLIASPVLIAPPSRPNNNDNNNNNQNNDNNNENIENLENV